MTGLRLGHQVMHVGTPGAQHLLQTQQAAALQAQHLGMHQWRLAGRQLEGETCPLAHQRPQEAAVGARHGLAAFQNLALAQRAPGHAVTAGGACQQCPGEHAAPIGVVAAAHRGVGRGALVVAGRPGLAGLALSHVIARAMLTGFVTRRIGFFRTPKRAEAHGLWQALADAREELLFLAALLLGAYAVLQRDDGMMLDIRIWALMLVVQGIPYAAAGLVSLISAAPRLPGRMVGVMSRLTHHRAH